MRLFICLICLVVLQLINVNGLALVPSKSAILKPFIQGKALKIISGLNNFDSQLVENIAWAAKNGGASHIDIACDPKLVKIAKGICGDVKVIVSSIVPADFLSAVEAGADMVELGNFDSFYDKGIKFYSEDILEMAIETRKLLPNTPLSVTIPHTLKLSDQIDLAQKLEKCGVDIIQTEGKISANVASMGVQELIEVAAPSLAAAYALSRAVNIPVMCSSGITDVTAPLALSAGAKGVGIGSMVNKLSHRQQMLLAVSSIAKSMNIESMNEFGSATVEETNAKAMTTSMHSIEMH